MPTGPPNPGDLTRLLDTERRLEERLRAAHAERDAAVAGAQAAADARERALDEGMALEQRRLTETLAAERKAGEREIAVGADREAAAFEGIPDGRLTAVAQALLQRFLHEPAGLQ